MITEWALIKKDFDEIKDMREEFITLRRGLTTFTGDDKRQMLKDFEISRPATSFPQDFLCIQGFPILVFS